MESIQKQTRYTQTLFYIALLTSPDRGQAKQKNYMIEGKTLPTQLKINVSFCRHGIKERKGEEIIFLTFTERCFDSKKSLIYSIFEIGVVEVLAFISSTRHILWLSVALTLFIIISFWHRIC